MAPQCGKNTLCVGILGCAKIAQKNVRAISLADDDIVVVAVGSRNKAKAEAFIKETGLAHATAHGSYDAVLADPDVHAVYIPLPAGLHVEWVRKAAAAGKHVLCEKPISLTREAADDICHACEEAGVQFMDGTMWVHNARTAEMATVLKQGVGQLKEVVSTLAFPAPEAFMKDDVRVQPDLDGLGCLGDLGWYCVRASLWANEYEPPAEVQAHAGALRNAAGVLTHVGATLVWPGGRRASFECSFDRAPVQHLEVAGTEGALELSDFLLPVREGAGAFRVKDAAFLAELDTKVVQSATERRVPLHRPQEAEMWRAFAACARRVRAGGRPDPAWPQQALLTQRVLCAVADSAADGCCVVRL